MDEVTAMATDLFTKFIYDVTMQAEERAGWEHGMLSLPRHLTGYIDDIVIFPFGTFYHGIGSKSDPLTGYVAIGNYFEESEPIFNTLATGDELPLMRQKLLIQIYDVLRSPDTGLRSVYLGTTLTRHGKLYFHHIESGEYFLEARSFLPVQTSRLIKFYSLLGSLFWPFCQLLVHWARGCDVLEPLGQADSDGLKQDQFILLLIFFLVRKRVIPSFKLLHEWRNNSVIVDGREVAFCENVDVVRKNCEQMDIGKFSQDESVLQTMLQLCTDFFNEMAAFDFSSVIISPSTGIAVKKTFHQHVGEGKRLVTSSAMCLQEILDEFSNATRRVKTESVLYFRLRCRHAGYILQSHLWSGNMLSAMISMLDKPLPLPAIRPDAISAYLPNPLEFVPNPGRRRCIQFRVPSNFVSLLQTCFEIGGGRDDIRACYMEAMKPLFFQHLVQVNQLFWRKLCSKQIIDHEVTSNQLYFEGSNPLELSLRSSSKTLCETIVSGVLANYRLNPGYDACRFHVASDWTKQPNQLINGPAEEGKSKAFLKTLNDSILEECLPFYGSHPGEVSPNYVLAGVELNVLCEGNEITLVTIATPNDSPHCKADPESLDHLLDWYNVLVKKWTLKCFTNWIGYSVMRKLRQKFDLKLSPESGRRGSSARRGRYRSPVANRHHGSYSQPRRTHRQPVFSKKH